MTDRSTTLRLITIGLAGFGVYAASLLPGMLIGPPAPLLLIGFALQALFALMAAIGVWRRTPWAATAVLLLGVSVAVTMLIEAFVIGIVAYLPALGVAVLAIALALVVATYLNRAPRHEALP